MNHAASGTEGIPADLFLQLLTKARQMAAESTHPDAASLDVEAWLRVWLNIPQPALGRRRPLDMLDTAAGREATLRVLGAIFSGTFQ